MEENIGEIRAKIISLSFYKQKKTNEREINTIFKKLKRQ